MATFTIIEINGDHVHDVDPESLGRLIQFMVSHPGSVNPDYEPVRAVKWIGTTGEPIKASDIKQYWLAKPEK